MLGDTGVAPEEDGVVQNAGWRELKGVLALIKSNERRKASVLGRCVLHDARASSVMKKKRGIVENRSVDFRTTRGTDLYSSLAI